VPLDAKEKQRSAAGVDCVGVKSSIQKPEQGVIVITGYGLQSGDDEAVCGA
jgi:hypothetical protein